MYNRNWLFDWQHEDAHIFFFPGGQFRYNTFSVQASFLLDANTVTFDVKSDLSQLFLSLSFPVVVILSFETIMKWNKKKSAENAFVQAWRCHVVVGAAVSWLVVIGDWSPVANLS